MNLKKPKQQHCKGTLYPIYVKPLFSHQSYVLLPEVQVKMDLYRFCGFQEQPTKNKPRLGA